MLTGLNHLNPPLGFVLLHLCRFFVVGQDLGLSLGVPTRTLKPFTSLLMLLW